MREMKKVISALAKDVVCERCLMTIKGIMEPAEELFFYSFNDKIEFIKRFVPFGTG